MGQPDWNTLTIMATVAGVAGGSMLWLSAQFRRVERLFYKEIKALEDELKRDYGEVIEDHKERLMRLELKLFGLTQSGPATSSKVKERHP